jgi:uncharacterized protein YecE (DUF72 family)
LKRSLENLNIGLSGIQLPVPKYQFPKEFENSSRLSYYSTFFNSIEINSSFYKIPLKRTLEKWCEMVPQNFTFTFKLFKEITHCKHLRFDPSLVEKFIETINHVDEKKGCLLVQFPPGLKINDARQLEELLSSIQQVNSAEWKIAVEFRDKSWYEDEIFDLLNEFSTALVLQDIPKSATPFRPQELDFVYVRFHGPTGDYRGSYSEAHLAEYASYVTEWLDDNKKVFVYFNNTAGDAFSDARAFQKLIK